MKEKFEKNFLQSQRVNSFIQYLAARLSVIWLAPGTYAGDLNLDPTSITFTYNLFIQSKILALSLVHYLKKYDIIISFKTNIIK